MLDRAYPFATFKELILSRFLEGIFSSKRRRSFLPNPKPLSCCQHLRGRPRYMSCHTKESLAMRFLLAIILTFGIPYLLYWLAITLLIPFFGITNHPVLAAILITCIPSGFCVFAGFMLGSGAKFPDN